MVAYVLTQDHCGDYWATETTTLVQHPCEPLPPGAGAIVCRRKEDGSIIPYDQIVQSSHEGESTNATPEEQDLEFSSDLNITATTELEEDETVGDRESGSRANPSLRKGRYPTATHQKLPSMALAIILLGAVTWVMLILACPTCCYVLANMPVNESDTVCDESDDDDGETITTMSKKADERKTNDKEA